MKTLSAFFWVGAGGALGAMLRYSFTLYFQKFSIVFPWGTFVSNVLGCLIIGALSQMIFQTQMVSPEMRLLWVTGFCGGLTTWSSLVYESMEMTKVSEWFYLALYAGRTFVISILVFYMGMVGIKLLLKG